MVDLDVMVVESEEDYWDRMAEEYLEMRKNISCEELKEVY